MGVQAKQSKARLIEYNISDTQTMATTNISETIRYGIPFKNGLICQGSTCTWQVQSIFGTPTDNVIGKYFNFMMYSTQARTNIAPMVQLVDGSYLNCQMDGNTQYQNVYTATCNVSEFDDTVQIYKYGFIFYDANAQLRYTMDWEISPIYYFDTFNDYTAGITDISNKMTQVFNNISNTNNIITAQMQQDQINYQGFYNTDISNADKTQPDTSTISNVQNAEAVAVNGIKTAIQNVQAPTFDLRDFKPTFAWIWQTIIYVFTTHSILMTTMVIVLSLGFVKTIFAR